MTSKFGRKIWRVLLFVIWPLGILVIGGNLWSASAEPSANITFAVIGDYGSAVYPEEGQVASMIHSWNPDLIITVGDNNYEDGFAADIDNNIGQYYHDFIFPYTGSYGAGATTNKFWPSLGNHDWGAVGN